MSDKPSENADSRAVKAFNSAIQDAYDELRRSGVLSTEMPVASVRLVHIDEVQANDYNPNSVATQEMRLLYTSIEQDGYTQPVVTIYDPDLSKYIIVDGFHRYTTMRTQRDIYDATSGYLPVVVIDKPIADRVASTVRHNRARGKHSVAGMSSLVFTMLREGESDETICNKIGLEAEELQRLKYITGFAKLFESHQYGPPVLNETQVRIKRKYKKEHPDEHVPTNI